MKKIICLCLGIMISLFSLAGCSKREDDWVCFINSSLIDRPLYIYFLSEAYHDGENLTSMTKSELLESTIEDKPASEWIEDKAFEYCRIYSTVLNETKKKDITLSSSEKAELSEKVNTYWSYYSSYYTRLNVERSTIFKALESEFYKDALFRHYYDEGGERAVSEDELKKWFADNYIVYKPLTIRFSGEDENGNEINFSDEDIENIKKQLSSYAERINNNGETIDYIYNEYMGVPGYTEPATTGEATTSETQSETTTNPNETAASQTEAARAYSDISVMQIIETAPSPNSGTLPSVPEIENSTSQSASEGNADIDGMTGSSASQPANQESSQQETTRSSADFESELILDLTFISKESAGPMDASIYEQLSSIEKDKAVLMTLDNQAVLAVRCDPFINDEEIYLSERIKGIASLKGEEFDEFIKQLGAEADTRINRTVLDELKIENFIKII